MTTEQCMNGVLHRARVPATLLEADNMVADEEGMVLVDITLAEGRVTSIVPAAPVMPEGGHDLDGGMVMPLFVDLHTHLDKGHIWPRAANPDGTHSGAAAAVRQDRQRAWSEEDIGARFEFALRCAYAHGTAALRTHLDCYELKQALISWQVFSRLQEQWQGRVHLQGVSMARLDAYRGESGKVLLDLVSRHGGLLGGILRTGGSVADDLDFLFQQAATRNLDVDLHVDETGDAAATGLREVAQAVLRNGFQGRVTCGHCCSLSRQGSAQANETLALVRKAGLAIVTLPMVNLYLQDRKPYGTPLWRGLTLVQELRAAGVPVVAASDNCRDPFFPFGDLDGLEVFREFVRLAHLDQDWTHWLPSVTRIPADIMGLQHLGRIRCGMQADLLLFRARSMSELLARPQSDRRVMRRGRIMSQGLPDYRELDGLMLEAGQEEVAAWM